MLGVPHHLDKRDQRTATTPCPLSLAVVALFRSRDHDAKLDPNMVAVAPFRVSGDTSLQYLQERSGRVPTSKPIKNGRRPFHAPAV
jgi:hypothetical protein